MPWLVGRVVTKQGGRNERVVVMASNDMYDACGKVADALAGLPDHVMRRAIAMALVSLGKEDVLCKDSKGFISDEMLELLGNEIVGDIRMLSSYLTKKLQQSEESVEEPTKVSHAFAHKILDGILASYLLAHAGAMPSTVSMMELVSWHWTKVLEEHGPNTAKA